MIPKEVLSLLPFVRRARLIIVGRTNLLRSRSNLHFILIADELSDNSREDVLRDFAPYPIVSGITEAEILEHFGLKGTRIVGIAKSDLAKNIYQFFKANRVNKPSQD